MNIKYLSYDIGGSFVKYGLFNNEGDLVHQGKFNTLLGIELKNQLVKHYNEIEIDHGPIKGIGIGMPGLIKNNRVLSSANLKLSDYPIVEELQQFISVPITCSNDVSMATLGEKYFGSAIGLESFMMVTIGTGIGAGIIIEGNIFEGKQGAFGELGHSVIVEDGRTCTCGNRGCLEMYASLRGITTNYYDITGNEIRIDDLVKMDDSIAKRQAFDQAAQKLGHSLANCITLLNLDAVIIGGGLVEVEYLLNRIRYWVNYYSFPALPPVRIEKAILSNDAGIYGSFHRIKEFT